LIAGLQSGGGLSGHIIEKSGKKEQQVEARKKNTESEENKNVRRRPRKKKFPGFGGFRLAGLGPRR
jgi:hypothetical protein